MTSLIRAWTQRAAACAGTAALAASLAAMHVSPASADDIEVFYGAKPSQVNILILFDTSATMWTVESGSAQPGYDQLPDGFADWGEALKGLDPDAYACRTTSVFFASGATLPTCSATTPGISNGSTNNLYCTTSPSNAGIEGQLQANDGVLNTAGLGLSVSQRVGSTWRKQTPDNTDLPTVCRVGTTIASPAPSPAPAASRFQSFSGSLYTGDRLNYEAYKKLSAAPRIRLAMDAMKAAIEAVEDSNVRFGMMRFSGADSLDQSCDLSYYTGSEYQAYITDPALEGGDGTGQGGGGMVIAPIMALGDTYPPGTPPYANSTSAIHRTPDPAKAYAGLTQQTKLTDILTDDLLVYGQGSACPVPLLTPNGRTAIAETLLEARNYLKGLAVSEGKNSNVASFHPWPSDEAAMTMKPGTTGEAGGYPLVSSDLNAAYYVSPITESCNPLTAIILLSDGGTQQDDPSIETEYSKLTGGKECDDDGLGTAGSPSPCVDDIAEFLYDEMEVSTYTVIYKVKNEKQKEMLKDAAERSKGDWKDVTDAEGLLPAFNETIGQILTRAASFTSPAVAVNAFNRTQNADQIFVSMFEPSASYRWNGNAKRYRINASGQILDRTGALAVDPDKGYFIDTAKSYWSPPSTYGTPPVPCTAPNPATDADGADVPLGGAANMLRCVAPSARKLYREYASGTDGVASVCLAGSPAVTRADLGLPDTATDADLADAVSFLCDHTGDSEKVSPMGDPLHSRPALYQYLVSAVDSPPVFETTLFVTTNDGILHAIDTDDGIERWSFMPADMLARTKKLYDNDALDVNPADSTTPVREYGLDGSVRVFRDTKADKDANGNYPAYLFFGERRGGGHVYGLDISDPAKPKLMWKLDGASLGITETWSTPIPTYVLDPADGNQPKPVVIFGGGYDVNHETLTGSLQTDSSGSSAIYVVDAVSGNVLATINPDGMDYAIPAEIRVIDLIGADDIVDRLYAADLGGQIWRFDFDYRGVTLDSAPGSVQETIVGGLLASLGGAEATNDPDERRRFFYPPDAAIASEGGSTWITLAVGSGHREFPRSDTVTDDRLFSIRDKTPFAIRPADSYTSDAVIKEADLQGLQVVNGQIEAIGSLSDALLANGWYLQLEAGEKILSESRTFGSQLFSVSTKSEYVDGVCPGYELRNRLYVLSPKTGFATTNLDGQAGNDPYKDLALGDSISPEPVFLFPPDTGVIDPGTGLPVRPPPSCLVGLERCPAPLFNPPTRTFWKQRGQQ